MRDSEFFELLNDKISGSTGLFISFINLAIKKLHSQVWDFQQFREHFSEFSHNFRDMQVIQGFYKDIVLLNDIEIPSYLENKLKIVEKQIQLLFNSFLAIIDLDFKGQELQFLTISNTILQS